MAKPAKLLNVNDDEANRYAVTRILELEGFEVIEASTGEECLRKSEEALPDLIVLDVQLPDISGFEACRRIKINPLTKNIPVLHLTANALGTANKVQSLREGADAYVTFPLEPPYLIATIRSLLRLRQLEGERAEALAQEKEKSQSLAQALKDLETERKFREQFVATLTHDLRTPMAAINMSAQLALRNLNDPEKVSSQLSRIIQRTEQLNGLVENLLDVSLIRAGGTLPSNPELFSMETLGRQTLDEQTSLHGDRFHLKTEGNLQGHWDLRFIKRMLDNLLQNAVKYGSAVDPISLKLHQEQDNVVVEVTNFGNPIPEENLKELFLPFRRSDATHKKGWGLGLTLVKGVAQSHQGEIKVTSSARDGTTFKITLPKTLPNPGKKVERPSAYVS